MAKVIQTEAPESFTEWAADLPDRFVECRNDQHRWTMLRARWDLKMNAYQVLHRCSRCRCGRDRSINAIGVVLSTRYDYPDNYLAPKGSGTFDKDARADLRLMGITRWLDKHAVEEDVA